MVNDFCFNNYTYIIVFFLSILLFFYYIFSFYFTTKKIINLNKVMTEKYIKEIILI